jgi:hypothetical protein
MFVSDGRPTRDYHKGSDNRAGTTLGTTTKVLTTGLVKPSETNSDVLTTELVKNHRINTEVLTTGLVKSSGLPQRF